MTLQIEIVPILSDNYVYLVRDEASGRVACVDPGEAAPVLAAAEEKSWEIDTILITHHHGDHVGGVATIKAATGATVIGPGGDSQPIPSLDQSVADGDVVEFGDERLAVIGVYGHT
ncbi:MAG: hydroxyacylglutathione hydrolase family protein, partial [Alphaproteobacteria bacterium]